VIVRKFKTKGTPRNPPVIPQLFKKNEAYKTYLEIKKTFNDLDTNKEKKEVTEKPRPGINTIYLHSLTQQFNTLIN